MPNFSSLPGPSDPRLAEAASLLSRKAYREAHALCVEVLKTTPDNAEAFYLLGLVTSTTMGGFIHILLVVAVVMVLLNLIQGRRVA